MPLVRIAALCAPLAGCSLFGPLPATPAEATPQATRGLSAPHVVCRCSATVDGLAWCVEYEGGGVAAAAVEACRKADK